MARIKGVDIPNDKQVGTYPKQAQGELEFDISNYLVSGDNVIQIKILDMYGTTGLTVGVIEGVSLELKSTFNQESAYYGKRCRSIADFYGNCFCGRFLCVGRSEFSSTKNSADFGCFTTRVSYYKSRI